MQALTQIDPYLGCLFGRRKEYAPLQPDRRGKKLFGELREEICFEEGYPIQTIWDGRQRLIGMLREARESQEKKPAFLELYRYFYSEEAYRNR